MRQVTQDDCAQQHGQCILRLRLGKECFISRLSSCTEPIARTDTPEGKGYTDPQSCPYHTVHVENGEYREEHNCNGSCSNRRDVAVEIIFTNLRHDCDLIEYSRQLIA